MERASLEVAVNQSVMSTKGRPMVLHRSPRLGLSLPNRAVLFGAITVEEIAALSEEADASGHFDSIWVGDSILTKPRLEALMLLSALAARTKRVRLGPACLASFPLRNPLVLAYQWASLDVISGGRTVLAVCLGATHTAGQRFAKEYETFGIDPRSRAARLEEGIEAIRLLWTTEESTYHGKYIHFDGITLEPKPVQKPAPPIWIASNPRRVDAAPKLVRRILGRVGRLADGWMTAAVTPEEFAADWAQIVEAASRAGRDPRGMETAIHHMVNINDDIEKAYAEGKAFLDTYYTTNYSESYLKRFMTYGPPETVARQISEYITVGVGTVVVRFTSWEPMQQMHRFLSEVVPLIGDPIVA
jgi:alkanesulfonate monooxygenase SsuD/methylene tetrahydromethanopterin reductase-like flavin-dependent oxidoreductase (luciferase family)